MFFLFINCLLADVPIKYFLPVALVYWWPLLVDAAFLSCFNSFWHFLLYLIMLENQSDVITFLKNLLNYFILCPVVLCIDRLRCFMLCLFILVLSLIRIRFFNLLQSFSIIVCHFSVCNTLHRTVECLGFNRFASGFSWMDFEGGLEFTTRIWSLVIVWGIKWGWK